MRYAREIAAAADARGLEPALVEALVLVESAGEPYAWKPEATYRYLVNARTGAPFRALTTDEVRSAVPPPDFPCLAGSPIQEWQGQRASWGLCQVMGAVARERGFVGPYLTMLIDPGVNLGMGCGLLAELLRWADGNEAQALAAYNAGKGGYKGSLGQQYARKVLAVKAAR